MLTMQKLEKTSGHSAIKRQSGNEHVAN